MKDSQVCKTVSTTQTFPTWFSLDNFPISEAYRYEIYLNDDSSVENLYLMFERLFSNIDTLILCYDTSWWDICIETWDINNNLFNYTLQGKSVETCNFLKMLEDNNITKNYNGFITSTSWDIFLDKLLPLVLTGQAPYCPLFYIEKYEIVFYFHHSGSIGLYAHQKSEFLQTLLISAGIWYEIVSFNTNK